MVIALIQPRLVLALIGPVDHPTIANDTSAASDPVTSNGANSPVKQCWCLQSSLSASAPVANQQQHHPPQISPLTILRLKSEEMTESCGRNRGWLEEARKVGRFYVYSAT